jgi:hypothetical protein
VPKQVIVRKEVILKKLTDYSGELLPNLEPGDFSSDTLAQLLKLYSKLYTVLDGLWYLTVKERLGDKEALACDIRVWEHMSKYETASIKRQLRIRGNDVTALIKTIQLCPFCLMSKCKIEIKNKNSAMFTVTYCPTLDALEKEGKGREVELCNTLGPKIRKANASFINPDIEVKGLKLPPRKSEDDICCQWEFNLRS